MGQKEKSAFVRYMLAILTFVLIATFSMFAALLVKKSDENLAKNEFDVLSKDTINIISNSIDDYLSLLYDIKAFFEASEYVSPGEWKTYFESIKSIRKYTGIRTIAFLPCVRDSELNEFLSRARKEVSPNYEITPSGRREKYFPIYYCYRFTEANVVFGLDHYSNDERKVVIDSAVQSGEQRITGKVKWFFQDKSSTSQNGVVIYTPVYNKSKLSANTPQERTNSIVGLISCAVVSEVFFPSLLIGMRTNYIDMEAYIGEGFTEDNKLVSNMRHRTNQLWVPKYKMVIKDSLRGKSVAIILTSTPEFEEKVKTKTPAIIAVSGNILGVVLSLLVGLQIKLKRQAIDLMEKIKKSEETLRLSNDLLDKQNREKEELIKEIEFEKHMLDELMENIPDAVYFKDINSRFIRLSKEALRKIGVEDDEHLIGKTDFDLFTEEHARPAFEDEQQIIKTGVPIVGKIEKETWCDGRVTYALTTKMPYRDKDGKIIGTFGISKDITELKEAQERLEQEKELLEITLASIGDAVISTDIEGRIVLMNRIAEKMTGWTNKEAIGEPLTKVFVIVNAETRKPAFNPVEKVIKTGEICGLANNTVLIAKDGSEKIIADSAAPIKDKGGKTVGVVLVFRDVSEKHMREKEMIKVARLEMLERLASGLAHDFNNILTAVMGNISFVKMLMSSNEQITGLLDQAEKACVHAKNITRQLLIFTKGGEPLKKPLNLNPLIKQAVEVAVYSTSVIVKYDLPKTELYVEGDDLQLSQAITHLVTYSVEAMKKKGDLFISATKTTSEEVPGKGLEPIDYAKIVIQDHSEGISSEKISKFFEPYSSHIGLGNGLGLASSDMIIRRHGGKIEIHSVLNKGTTFVIYLPLSKSKIVAEASKAVTSYANRGNRVLIMDDEESICSLVKMILEREGYQVETCYDGEETIRRYTAALNAGVPFDLVILDLTIEGGIGGKEVIVELKKINPKVRAVVSSGYSFDPVIANYNKYGFIGALQKPYDAKELKNFIDGFMKQ
ncbi:MAG: CHASE domain-containing protein [Verrucomicrobiae bacterium]|nr:CHASE domain-containing protein [Verrucomicrobiae bacterium]